MLNFRNTIVALVAVLIFIMIFDYWLTINVLVYGIVVLIFMVILAWGSKSIKSGFYIQATCRGDSQVKSIAITFDDGPDAQVTPMILDVLKECNVKAAFFVIGSKAQKHPEIIKRMEKEGHVIGNHTWTHHFFFDLFSYQNMKAEMIKTEDIIFSITGKKPAIFRPPYGVTNPPLAKAIRHLEYLTIGWSLKSNDTVIEHESVLLNNLKRKLKNGDVVLFHDNKPWTVNVIKKFMEYLVSEGYSVNRLDKLLKIQAYVN